VIQTELGGLFTVGKINVQLKIFFVKIPKCGCPRQDLTSRNPIEPISKPPASTEWYAKPNKTHRKGSKYREPSAAPSLSYHRSMRLGPDDHNIAVINDK